MMKSLESHVAEIIEKKVMRRRWDVPLDYFSWGRDSRHIVDNKECLPVHPLDNKSPFRKMFMTLECHLKKSFVYPKIIIARFRREYGRFEQSYQLMSDQYSKNLFAELIVMKLVSENEIRLHSFSQDFIDSYEKASKELLGSDEILPCYNRELRKVTISHPAISIYTDPVVLNLHLTGRLYRYQHGDVLIEVEPGDVVLDAGIGWGDTTVYLASLAGLKPKGHSYAFDVLEEGMRALTEQLRLNPKIKNITPSLYALYDCDGIQVNISSPCPGAHVVEHDTGRQVETITLDSFVERHNVQKVDFIKMDIEGAEGAALKGACKIIKNFKPKLAISVYHKWDDLLEIPQLIKNIREDYCFYLDCTTGFGGESVLYCH